VPLSPFLSECTLALTRGAGGVQVWQRPRLLRNKELLNSYRTLARRAAKSNNWLNRTVRKVRNEKTHLLYISDGKVANR
jgi:hypothetical protein